MQQRVMRAHDYGDEGFSAVIGFADGAFVLIIRISAAQRRIFRSNSAFRQLFLRAAPRSSLTIAVEYRRAEESDVASASAHEHSQTQTRKRKQLAELQEPLPGSVTQNLQYS